MSEPLDDIVGLREQIAQGDDAAAQQLIDLGTPLLLARCRAHRPRHLAVGDLAQEVFWPCSFDSIAMRLARVSR